MTYYGRYRDPGKDEVLAGKLITRASKDSKVPRRRRRALTSTLLELNVQILGLSG